MKILLANKYLYPRGGDCIYTLRLMDLLREKGHEVILFGMAHPQNIETEYSKYFVPYIDFREELKAGGLKNAMKVISRAIVNRQANDLLEKLIKDTKPDIVHLNNIHHQLTPEILHAPAKYNIPVVWTLHDYILNCPDHEFLRNGRVCEKCADGNNIYAVVHRCKKRSFGASLIAAMESTYHNPIKLARLVNKFITPSRFMEDILTSHGLPEGKVTAIPNFLPVISSQAHKGDYFLYVGRLSKAKGVDILIKAFAKLGIGKLIVVGDGPDKEELEKLSHELTQGKVEFAGHQPQESVFKLLSLSLAVIVPSVWRENFPYSIMEAMAIGKPVIASRIGGIPEQVDHGKTGFLFRPGNSHELSSCMAKLYENRAIAEKMGAEGKSKALGEYSADTHYEKIMGVYNGALTIKGKTKKRITIKNFESSLS